MAENIADVIVSLRADFGDALRQVESLPESFSEVGKSATDAAEQMALFGEALDQIPFAEASGQLNLFTTELEPISGQTEAVSESIQTAEESTRSWKDILSALIDKLTETGEAEAHAENHAAEFAKEMLALAGIGLSLEAAKEMIVETFEAFAKEERATEALTALMHSSEEAEKAVESLRKTSLALAVSDDVLRNTFQQMVAREFEVERLPKLLESVADASRAMNSSFEGTSMTVERMIQSGTLNNRMLTRLGLSIQDVAKIMEVSAGDAPKYFKELDQSERIDVVTSALEKFKGLARSTAGDLTGSWQNLKNTAEHTFEDIGKQLEPLAKEFLAWARDSIGAVKEMALNVIDFGKQFAALPGIVKESILLIGVAMASNPTVAMAVSLFQLALAAQGARSATQEADNAWKTAGNNLQNLLTNQRRLYAEYPEFQVKLRALTDEWDQGKKTDEQFIVGMRDLTVAFRQLHPAAEQAAEDAKKVHKIPYDQMKLQIDAETKQQLELIKLQRMGIEQRERLGVSSLADDIDILLDLNEKEYRITKAGIDRKLALEKGAKEAEKDLTLGTQAQEARAKRNEEDYQLRSKLQLQIKKLDDDELAHWSEIENKRREYAQRVAEEREKLDEATAKDSVKAAQLERDGVKQHRLATLETDRMVEDAKKSLHQMGVFERLQMDANYAAQEEALQKESLQREIDAVGEDWQLTETEASRKQELLNKLQALQDKADRRKALAPLQQEAAAWKMLGSSSAEALTTEIADLEESIRLLKEKGAAEADIEKLYTKQLEDQIQLNEQQGRSTSELTVKLDLQRAKLEAMKTSAAGLGGVFVTMKHSLQQAFDSIGPALGQLAVYGGKFKDTLKQIEAQVLGSLIGAVLKLAEAWVINLILGKGVEESLIVAEAARGGAAAAASTAAIPIIGPALAMEAGLAMMASILGTFGPLALAESGFDVGPEEVLTMLHPHEMVLPKDLAEGVRGVTASGGAISAGATTGDHYDFRGANFGAGLTEKAISQMMDFVFHKARLAGMRPKLA